MPVLLNIDLEFELTSLPYLRLYPLSRNLMTRREIEFVSLDSALHFGSSILSSCYYPNRTYLDVDAW